MNIKQSRISTAIISFSIVIFYACGHQSQIDKSSSDTLISADSIQSTDLIQTIAIDTFSTFPPEIDGCSCYFSNDSIELKKEKYIYINDFAQTSFLKINGTLTKFTQTEYKETDKHIITTKAKNKDYELTIEIKEIIKKDYETSINIGIIKLTDKKGNTITRIFYGECGC